MSAEHDGDSQMLSSPEESDNEMLAQSNASVPSPPDSTYRSHSRATTSQTQPFGSSVANSNGKRPLIDISNGKDDSEELAIMSNSKTRQDLPIQTHQPSGYTWSSPEDAPGYAWLNKKAMDEQHRASENVVHHEYLVMNKYGDPFQIAEKENAIMSTSKGS